MNSNQTLLCPVFNADILGADLCYAAELARVRNKKLILLTVLEFPEVEPFSDAIKLASKMDVTKRRQENKLAKLAHQIKDKYQIEVFYDTEFGVPAEEIVQVAMDYNVGAICMGWCQKNDNGDMFCSLAKEITLTTNSPLILVPPKVKFTEVKQLVRWYKDQNLNYDVKFPFWLLQETERNIKIPEKKLGEKETTKAKDNFYSIRWEPQVVEDFLREKEGANPDYFVQVHQEDLGLLSKLTDPRESSSLLTKVKVPFFIQPKKVG